MQKVLSTPGPWCFVVNPATKTLYLASQTPGRPTVFDCVRWGMQRATIRFSTEEQIMEPAHEIAEIIPGREHHKDWALQLSHPDALLIQAAPTLLNALVHARNVIKDWHNMSNPDLDDDRAWSIYEKHAPEMQLINRAILEATPQLHE